MQPQSRLGDYSRVPADDHGKECCKHDCQGPAETGSSNVMVNSLPALRVTDTGIHYHCCDANTWVAVAGSRTVLINNLRAHRKGDADKHCGGPGFMIQGSANVMVGG
jgi:uncharacterized Zn-binding protein involved in type VI secretion